MGCATNYQTHPSSLTTQIVKLVRAAYDFQLISLRVLVAREAHLCFIQINLFRSLTTVIRGKKISKIDYMKHEPVEERRTLESEIYCVKEL